MLVAVRWALRYVASIISKRCLRPTRDQLDVVKFQGISSSILLAG